MSGKSMLNAGSRPTANGRALHEIVPDGMIEMHDVPPKPSPLVHA